MKFFAFLLATALAATAARPDTPGVPPPLSLADVLRLAGSNVDVAVARSGLDAARADILAADHAPLPQLTLKSSQMDLQHGLGPGNLFADKRIDKSVGVDWTWERGDKRALRTAAARAAAEASAGDMADVRRQQLVLALGASVDLAAAQQRVQEVAALKRGADELIAAMRVRHRAGDISAQDLARAQIEAARAGIDLASAGADRRRASLALARLIGRSGDDIAIDASAWPAPTDAPPLDDAQRALLTARRADVQAAEARIQAAQAVLDGTLAARKSDVTWGVSVDHYPGTSNRFVELRLQMPLQIGYAQQGETGRARAQLQQARDLADRTRLLAEADLNQAALDLQASARTLAVHETELLPKARQVLAQAELAYRKGAMSLTDLVDARRSLRTAVLDALAARADHARATGAWALLTDPEFAKQP
jgi:cobalt-zinc-cadmium efflux system outer membrane protein